MKTKQYIIKGLLILSLFFISNFCIAQANEGFTYQAVIRNSSGALVANALVGVQISLLQNSSTGTVLFSERHTPTTNANGLATFVISEGTLLSGSFSAIDWGNVVVFLKTDTDPTGGTNYTITGTSQFKSVPFANYANNAGNTWKPSGNAVSTTDFIGSLNNADIVFKRNNVKSGFIAENSVALGRSALNSNTTGNFNVAFGPDALAFNNGSFNIATGFESQYANTTGIGNTSYGHAALRNNSGESYNTAVGFEALRSTTAGQNTAIGWQALNGLTTGGGNIGIGKLVNVPSTTTNNQLSIGNVIYGTNMGDTATGTIGIGVPVPTERLEVAGKTKTTNLQVTAGANAGHILTSDAAGNASWQIAPNANTGIHITKNTTQTIAPLTDVKIDFTNELTDDANAFNPTTDEWTVTTDGFYHIYATARFFTIFGTNEMVEMLISVNGVINKIKSYSIIGTSSFEITTDTKLFANDKVTILVYQSSGSNAILSSSPLNVYFTGYKIY